jgi:hypothetical protein
MFTITLVRQFVAALARAGKRQKEVKPLVDSAYPDKKMSISQINRIIKVAKEGKNTADQCVSNLKKTRRTGDVVAAVAASVDQDCQVTVKTLVARYGLCFGTVNSILRDNLGLVRESVHWVHKLLS